MATYVITSKLELGNHRLAPLADAMAFRFLIDKEMVTRTGARDRCSYASMRLRNRVARSKVEGTWFPQIKGVIGWPESGARPAGQQAAAAGKSHPA